MAQWVEVAPKPDNLSLILRPRLVGEETNSCDCPLTTCVLWHLNVLT